MFPSPHLHSSSPGLSGDIQTGASQTSGCLRTSWGANDGPDTWPSFQKLRWSSQKGTFALGKTWIRRKFGSELSYTLNDKNLGIFVPPKLSFNWEFSNRMKLRAVQSRTSPAGTLGFLINLCLSPLPTICLEKPGFLYYYTLILLGKCCQSHLFQMAFVRNPFWKRITACSLSENKNASFKFWGHTVQYAGF